MFDYLPPADVAAGSANAPPLGVRVRVPFGKQRLIGILVGIASRSAIASTKLKSVTEIVDQQPVYDPVTFDLLRWAAEYYHHPVGEVYASAQELECAVTAFCFFCLPSVRLLLRHSRPVPIL